MKLAFLCYNEGVWKSSFREIARQLKARGHEIAVFLHPKTPEIQERDIKFFRQEWWNFQWTGLESFNPDKIIVFNGSFDWCNAATQILKRKYKVIFAERAWLPQTHHIFFDPKGPGARSTLFQKRTSDCSIPQIKKDQMNEHLANYFPSHRTEKPDFLPKEPYIAVPFQIEGDTSILYDSPYFKTMHSLIGFVTKHFFDMPIVVKPHPLDKKEYNFKNVHFAPKDVPFHKIAEHAKATIAINSTATIESLACPPFSKSIGLLGHNVAINKGVFLEPETMLENPRAILDFSADPEQTHKALEVLYSHQVDQRAPDAWDLYQIVSM